jgi:L-asparaginase II
MPTITAHLTLWNLISEGDMNFPYTPVFELTRGETVESIHYGSIAVVDANGRLVAWHGDPQAVTFLRSSAKPLQALPFIEHGGQAAFGFTLREISLMCASHSGTDDHVAVLRSIQAKANLQESDLMCGFHPLSYAPTVEAMRQRGENVSPNRHNCSGKHTGMMAHARLHGWTISDYINPTHPVQQEIIQTFAEMCGLSQDEIRRGTDGCSAPNFAVPLRNAAFGFARMADPTGLPSARADACRTINTAMRSHPDMVGGPDSFDTLLMQTARDRIFCKGGAEGYQVIGLLPGAIGPGSPALGIALKISEGDQRGQARPAVVLDLLRQLGAVTPADMQALAGFGPSFQLYNWRKLLVGEARPCFQLQFAN